jgi:hypothetical protein
MSSGVDSSLRRHATPQAGGADAAARPRRPKASAGIKPPKAASAAPAPAKPATVTAQPPDGAGLRRSAILKTAPPWAVSMLLHIVVLLSLALMVQEPPKEENTRVITSSAPEVVEEFEEFQVDIPLEQPDTPDQQEFTEAVVTEAAVMENVEVVTDASDVDAAPVAVEFTDFSTETAPLSDLLSDVGAIGGKVGGLGGRSGAQRAKLVRSGGGSPQSERAVDAALAWFVTHQLADGSWTLSFNDCPSCKGQCGNSARLDYNEPAGITALALLPFLGRGYTHTEGPYQKQVEAGLAFLASRVMAGSGRAYKNESEATHPGYSQALATIALCEAYAMSNDERLRQPAQLAIEFIQDAQDPVGGGWQYVPRQPGGMSSTAFHVMALKSGHMAGLTVKAPVVRKASDFIDSMEYEHAGRVQYRYNTEHVNGNFREPNRQDPTSVSAYSLSNAGILCRMYMGWKKDHPAIRPNIERIVANGPSTTTPYYNYYATQVVHHYGGDAWRAWNSKMRDMLIATQATAGHEAGSWQFEEDHYAGRLWCTSLATMILEVYYRHLPIYSQQSVDEEFTE